MTFGAHYWPALDDPGSWLLSQINQITSATLHPNGMIDVLGRKTLGNQYCTLLPAPPFAFMAQVYSSDPNHNVPPAQIDPNNVLYEALCADGIGEVASGVPLQTQIPPLVILPNNTTPGFILNGKSTITGAAAYEFDYTTSVIFKGPWWDWKDCVVIAYHEPVNRRYINYAFAAAEQGKPSGLVLTWSVVQNADGTLTPGLESYALGAGRL